MIAERVLENPRVVDRTAPQLVKLVQIPRIRTLMTDLFIVMLNNKGFKEETTRIFDTIIHDYLNS